MSGQELRQKLNNTGISLSELAVMMKTSQPNLSQKLDASDIKTGFIEELCNILNKDLYFIYGGTKYLPEGKVSTDPQTVPKFLYDELRQEVYEYRDTIRDLENQIALMRQGIPVPEGKKDAE